MYSVQKTDKNFTTDGGSEMTPVVTLADGFGGKCQIAIDDNCYVLYLKQEGDVYKRTSWIFPEVHEVLRTLPHPRVLTDYAVNL